MARTEAEQRLARLRAAIDEVAAEDVAELIRDARAEAREHLRALLAVAMTDAMVDQVEEQLRSSRRPRARVGNAPPARERATPPAEPATPPAREAATPPAERPTPPAERPTPPAERPMPAAKRPTPPPDRATPAADQPEPSPQQPRRGGHGVYVYGVVPAPTELPGDLPGVEPDAPPKLLRHGDLAGVVSRVSLAEFEEERLREHLADMAWVEATARAHELVLEMVGEVATLVPMRMCSVYRTEGGVREMLARESIPLSQALEHLEGKAEWGVKVFAEDAPKPTHENGTADASAGEEPRSGTDYMRERKSERDARWTVDEELHDACVAIHDQLSSMTTDALTAPLQRPELSGHTGQMLLNGVYLVDSEHQEDFLTMVEKLRTDYESLGLYLEPTGPWPAYNFVPGTIGVAW
jgi:hypothetical protein